MFTSGQFYKFKCLLDGVNAYLVVAPSVGDGRPPLLYTDHLLHGLKAGVAVHRVVVRHVVLFYDTYRWKHAMITDKT